MSRALEFRVLVNPRESDVELTVMMPDGELVELGVVTSPAQIPYLMPHFASFLALHVCNAIWDSRTNS